MTPQVCPTCTAGDHAHHSFTTDTRAVAECALQAVPGGVHTECACPWRGDARVVRPWPAERWPAADEWREWFLTLDAPAQHEAADQMLTLAQAAASCVEQGHATVLEVEAAELAAYTKGWGDGLAELRARLEQEWATEEATPGD